MKKIILLAFLIGIIPIANSQSNKADHAKFIKKADSLYQLKDYKNSANAYTNAFKSNGWAGSPSDRYNAACSWALANQPDSSFFHLNHIATKAKYSDYSHITTDTDLNSLHNDKRWNPLLQLIKQNKETLEAKLDKPLAAKLDSIYSEDQKYRHEIIAMQKKYGAESKEVLLLWDKIEKIDSSNHAKVTAILDKYGWLGADVAGQKGNTALFLVIQHADLKTQEKYLPMMRDAVKNGKANGSNLALLEDRILIRNGKKQIYGSQIGTNPETKENYVMPLENPEEVDERRNAVGLGPLAVYVTNWNIKWDAVQYKKDLPKYEEIEKKKNFKK